MAPDEAKAAAESGDEEQPKRRRTRSAATATAEGPKRRAPAKRAAKRPAAPTAEDVARRYFEAIASRDPDAMAELWADDGVDDLVPYGILRGPGEIRGYFREMFAALPDSEMRVQRVTAGDRVACVEWRLAGTFSGAPFQGVEPNGRRVELRGVDCVEVDEGRIVRNTAYWDHAAFARAVGMLPAQDSPAERALVSGFNALTRARHALRGLSDR